MKKKLAFCSGFCLLLAELLSGAVPVLSGAVPAPRLATDQACPQLIHKNALRMCAARHGGQRPSRVTRCACG